MSLKKFKPRNKIRNKKMKIKRKRPISKMKVKKIKKKALLNSIQLIYLPEMN